MSSGGFMSAQMHYIFSSEFSGAGVVSGGPFYCNTSLIPAHLIVACTKNPENIDLDALSSLIADLNIDPTDNLKDQKVWVYGGLLDTVVVQGVQDKLVEQYRSYGADVKYVNTLSSQHTFPTDYVRNTNACAYAGMPYISNCEFDGVHSMLTHILPDVIKKERVMNWADYGQIIEFDQQGPKSMDPKGYVYVPDNCVNGGCHLHVAFHGCSQSVSYLNETYV